LKNEIKITKTFIKELRKKIEIQRMRPKLENIIFDKLGLKDEIQD
jgi:hypothetical protein